jgi:ketosteroid isomerase-like protein
MRTTAEVLEDHLQLAKEGDLEQDLARNYAEDVVVFMSDGIYRGLNDVRALARRLDEELPSATFEYITVLSEGDVGFLEWRADARGAVVTDGADSFVIRDGKIVAQTIHYTVIPVEHIQAPQVPHEDWGKETT